MRGRAGRKGKDDVGESFLCCQTSDLEGVLELLAADLPVLESSLVPEKRGIQRSARDCGNFGLIFSDTPM